MGQLRVQALPHTPSLGSANTGSAAHVIILKLWVPVGYQDGAQHRRAAREQAGGHSCCVVHGRNGRIVIVGAKDNAGKLAHWIARDIFEHVEGFEIEIDPPMLHELSHAGGESQASEDDGGVCGGIHTGSIHRDSRSRVDGCHHTDSHYRVDGCHHTVGASVETSQAQTHSMLPPSSP